MSGLRVSVVVASRDRRPMLVALLDSLAEQTLDPSAFEVIVVDDGSAEDLRPVLAARSDPYELTVLRHDEPRGPAGARNAGWPVARAPVVAFTDDDCRASAGWLEAGLAVLEANPGAFVQGRVERDPDHLDRLTPFAHWYEVPDANQGFPTCNIFYARELLERLGGFDQERFPRVAGEDTDLGWRAIEAGARPVFASDACVYHAIVHVGPVARLRISWRWSDVVANYRLHPEMPKYKGVFWRHNHYELARFLLALALPKRLEAVRLMLAAPYLTHLTMRRTGPLIAPYLLLLDLTEMGAIVRGAIRHRVLVV